MALKKTFRRELKNSRYRVSYIAKRSERRIRSFIDSFYPSEIKSSQVKSSRDTPSQEKREVDTSVDVPFDCSFRFESNRLIKFK
mmetsp:Transcript_18000/g.27309  ORF Transcript_18000/g.27309 Transcript_18000/m.27309 type:complete len:84 (+) Transcript_18000:137-388(+)